MIKLPLILALLSLVKGRENKAREASALAPTERWNVDAAAAPFDVPLPVRVSADGSARTDDQIGIRNSDGWRVVSPQMQVTRHDTVAAWASVGSKKMQAHLGSAAPNLFVLGAGKCGTSSLHAWLQQHPDISASRVKEPSFFCSYFHDVSDPVEYLRLFDADARYRMESSHVYLTNPETPPVMKALFPDAKFVVTLRDPKNRAYSLYRHMRRLKHRSDGKPYEEIPDFLSALQAEPTRFESKEFFDTCRQYFWNFMYCRSSLYDEQLRRYFALFDRRQFLVVSLAELHADPVRAMEKIMDFLGLDPRPVKTFDLTVKNETRGHFAPYSAEADAWMSAAFDGLTARTDALVGRSLDWST